MDELKSVRSSSRRHGSLLDRRVGSLIFENGSDHGTSSDISPLLRAQTHTACTPPSSLLTVSAETFGTLGCSFDHSTNSGRVAVRSLPERRRGISWSASRNRSTCGRLICATGKSPCSSVKRSTAYLNSRSVFADRDADFFHPSWAALSVALSEHDGCSGSTSSGVSTTSPLSRRAIAS